MIRRILVVLAVVATLIALVAIGAFVPAVQRWVVLRTLAARPGTGLDMDRLAIRSGSIDFRRLDYVWPGGRMTVADGSIKVSLWDLIVHRRAVITDARITGVKVILSDPPALVQATGPGVVMPATLAAVGAAAPGFLPPSGPLRAAGRPAFAGLFSRLHLPLQLALEKCHVEAQVDYPQGRGKPRGQATVILTGGHLEPGQEARFDFEATFRNPDPRAAVDTVGTRGSLTATLSGQALIENVEGHFDAEARGPRLLGPARLKADAVLARNTSGESYTLNLSSPESGAANRLLGLRIDYVAGSAQLTGTWQVRANDSQIAPFTLGVALPQFSATGEGTFEFNPVTLATRLAGRLSGEFSRLEVIDARLRDFDGLSATSNFDVDYDDANVRVAGIAATLEGRKPLVVLQTIQPFSLELATHRLSAADPAKELVQVTIQGLPGAWLGPWLAPGLTVGGGELTGALDVELHGERVRVRTGTPLSVRDLSLSVGGRVLLPASDIDLQADVEHTKGASWLKLGQLSLTTAAGDYLEAHANLQLDRSGTPGAAVQADFEGTLPSLLAAYAPGVLLGVRGSVAGSLAGDILQVDRLALTAQAPAGQALADLALTQPFRFDGTNGKVTTLSGQAGEILRLKIGRLPLSVFQPYCDGWRLAGELAHGEISVASRAEKLLASTVSAWQLDRVSLGDGDRDWVKDLAVEVEADADYAAGGVTGRVTALRVRNAAQASVLTGQADMNLNLAGAQPTLRGAASFDLALPALAAQPVLGGLIPPNQGKLSGEIKFSRDHDLLGEGRMTLNGLMAPGTGAPLPVVNLSFRAGLSEAGDVALQVPLLIDRAGERSDLTLAATLHPVPGGHTFDARISSEHAVVDDLLALARSFTAAPSGPAAAEPGPPGPDVTGPAPWDGLTGQLAVGLKSVTCDSSTEITGVTGRLVVDPARVVAEQIAGRVGADGQLLLSARVDYAAGDPLPFASTVDLNVQDFEVGPYFKAAAADKPPTVEGRFNIRWRASGAGRTWMSLLDHTRGDVLLQSRKGIFRGLARPPPPPPRSGIVGGAARVLSDLGEKVGNLVVSPDAADALASQLAAVPYDQLNLRVSRDPGPNLKLADFSLVSPVLRLQGEGLITVDPGKGLLNQPLQMRLNMGVMGAVESALTHAKSSLLSGERDDLGYLKLREPFVIGGAPDKPDSSPFYTMVGRSLLDILRR